MRSFVGSRTKGVKYPKIIVFREVAVSCRHGALQLALLTAIETRDVRRNVRWANRQARHRNREEVAQTSKSRSGAQYEGKTCPAVPSSAVLRWRTRLMSEIRRAQMVVRAEVAVATRHTKEKQKRGTTDSQESLNKLPFVFELQASPWHHTTGNTAITTCTAHERGGHNDTRLHISNRALLRQLEVAYTCVDPSMAMTEPV